MVSRNFFPLFDRVLVLEIGVRETTRRLGLKEGTVLSYAYRHGWDLPKRRNVGRPHQRERIAIKAVR
jgi:hypothetical protein